MDPGEESFSLSSLNFTSSFKFYSSEDENEDHDADTYIEFDLGSSTTTTPLVNDQYDKDFEFPVSAFVPGFVPSPNIAPAVNSLPLQEDGSTSRGDFGNCTSPLFRIFRNAVLKRSVRKLQVGDGDREDEGECVTENWELVPSRKTSSKVISTRNGGVMSLLLKLRSSVITSSQSNKYRTSNWKISNLMKPIDKLFTNWHLVIVKRPNTKSKAFLDESKIVNVFRKMFFTNGRIRNNRVLGHNAPSRVSSVESSPIHQQQVTDATASSVHAAIAHCKKSLGQTEDFCF